MSDFNIEDLDAVIASANSSLVQMLALQLKKSLQQNAVLAADRGKFAVQCAAAKIAVQYAQAAGFECTLNTPDVEAYLNSVRAEGLEIFSNNSACPDELAFAVNDFAAQLRAGEPS